MTVREFVTIADRRRGRVIHRVHPDRPTRTRCGRPTGGAQIAMDGAAGAICACCARSHARSARSPAHP